MTIEKLTRSERQAMTNDTDAAVLADERELVRKALYNGLCWFGTLPEPEGDVPERYHRWDDLGEFADRILTALRETAKPAPSDGVGETYAAWQQKRGMLADAVDWAILEYDGFMKDDAYNAQRVLDRIIARLREIAALSNDTERPAAPDKLVGLLKEAEVKLIDAQGKNVAKHYASHLLARIEAALKEIDRD